MERPLSCGPIALSFKLRDANPEWPLIKLGFQIFGFEFRVPVMGRAGVRGPSLAKRTKRSLC